jgi:hypothetical protein
LQNISPGALDVSMLQRALIGQGVDIGEASKSLATEGAYI